MSIQTRWDALNDYALAIHFAGIPGANHLKILKKMIDENDTATMDALEVGDAEGVIFTNEQNVRDLARKNAREIIGNANHESIRVMTLPELREIVAELVLMSQ